MSGVAGRRGNADRQTALWASWLQNEMRIRIDKKRGIFTGDENDHGINSFII